MLSAPAAFLQASNKVFVPSSASKGEVKKNGSLDLVSAPYSNRLGATLAELGSESSPMSVAPSGAGEAERDC